MRSIEIRAEPQELGRASAWLQAEGEGLAIPADQIDRLEVCLNAVLANLPEHGGAPVATRRIQLELDGISSEGAAGVRLVISDAGFPFEPCRGKRQSPSRQPAWRESRRAGAASGAGLHRWDGLPGAGGPQ